jgi:hypothetical protein
MSLSNDQLRALQGIERSTTGAAGFTARVRFASSALLILLILLILSSCTAVGGPPLQVRTVSLQRGTVGTAYQAIMHAAGGAAPYSWTITTGSLPLGLTLDPSGVISGTPSQAVNSAVTVQVTDNGGQSVARNFVITVTRGGWGSPPPPAATLQVLSPAVPPARVGAPYQASLSATGGAQPYSWSVDSGSLPAGLALDATSGAINGMPNQAGDTSFTVRVTDAGSQSAVQPLAISVSALLQITTRNLVGGQVGTSYQASVSVTGGTQPYSWSIVSGALPSSLALNPASGTISGTPSTAGHSSFTMKVNDSAGQSAQQPLAISVAAAPPSPLQITTSSLAGGQVGTSYQASVSVTGGTQPYSWSIISGALPSSLALNPASGTISGMPSTAGNSSFTLKVSDSGSQSAQQPLVISVAAAPAAPLQITTSSLAGGQVGTSYQASVSVTGGTQPYSWSIVSGALPSSLALNPASGTISGTPSTAGHSSFTMKVNDSAGQSAQQPLAISVAAAPAAPLQITTSSLAGGQVGTSYQASVSVTGGTQPYSWSIVSGLLPTGLALNAASGAISGMPGTAGNSSFTVKVNDSGSQSAQQPLAISVVGAATPPLSVTTTSLPSGLTGQAYSATLQATGGKPAYTWSVAAGQLPPGMQLAASNGQITGTATTAGQYSSTVQVTDSSSPTTQTALQALTLAVAASQPAGSIPNLPMLPQKQVDVTLPDTTGYTVTAVTDTGNPLVNAINLQAAIINAICNPHGTILQLQHGASFIGAFTLPNKSCAPGQWILIESDASPSVLPAAGVRVKLSDAANMPTIISNQATPAITVVPGSSNYRLMFLEIAAGQDTSSAIVAIGDGNYQGPQNTAALQPSNVIIDRSYIHGSDNPPLHVKRGVQMDCQYCAVINSYISQIHLVGQDAQAIEGWNSTGPWLVDNNYLSASGENIIVGGASTTIPGAVPSDLTFTRNYLFKPLSWNWRAQGKPYGCNDCWEVKNLFELKEGVRVLVEGNIFENNWLDGQLGEAVVMKSENPGATPWVTTQDVTFRYNEILNSTGGSFDITCDNGTLITGPCTTRFYVHDNLATGVGGASGRYIGLFGDTTPQATYNGTQDLYFTHNTIITLPPNADGPFGWLSMESIVNPGYAPYVRFAFTNNIVGTYYKPVGSNCQVRPNKIVPCTTRDMWRDNLYYENASCGEEVWTAHGKCAAKLAKVGFIDPANGDYRLRGGVGNAEHYIGADLDVLKKQIKGTISGNWTPE